MLYYIINPTYNEAENISKLVSQVYEILSRTSLTNDKFIELIVDDNSPDGTAQLVKSLNDKYKSSNYELKVLERENKNGLASAYIDGFNFAIKNNAEYIIQMDADMSHKPEYLLDMIKLSKNYELVIGSRYIKHGKVENWSISRKILSKCGSIYARSLLNLKVHDCTTGYNLYSKNLLEKILKHGISMKGYGFLIEMKYLAIRKFNAKWIETPIIFPDRILGKSKMSAKIAREAIFSVLKLRKEN